MILKNHYCNKTPGMAYIEYNKKRIFGPGFELILKQRVTEGKISPKTYMISVPIDYCPFCGVFLEVEEHPNSCNCSYCEIERVFGRRE